MLLGPRFMAQQAHGPSLMGNAQPDKEKKENRKKEIVY
jgi:hypothetical protein